MTNKDIVKEFNETKEKLRPDYDQSQYQLLHDNTFSYLLENADKKTTLEVIDGIGQGKFATDKNERWMEVFATLPYIIRDNINDAEVVSASFEAMKTMLNTATDYIVKNDKEKAVYEVNAIQDAMLSVIAELRDLYPSKLGEYTDSVYEVYKNMMKEYALHGLLKDDKNGKEISDYYHGYDPYKDVKEIEVIGRQTDAAWDTNEKIDAAKQRVYNKFTKKEIADYEQRRTAENINIKGKEAQYVSELKKFVREHDNQELRKKRHDEMDIAWGAKEIWDKNKRRFLKELTDEAIADYEKRHAEQVKKEDARYRLDLEDFVTNHENRKRSKEHQEQITEIRLKHSDEELQNGYENYKAVARKPKKGEKAKEIPIRREVPKHAVFIARAESKRQA